MLKVNRKVEYGLVALKHMAAKVPGQLTSVREICDQYGTPFDPVAHVLRTLNSRDVVKSEQGAHGGYRLVADLGAISFFQYIEMIEGNLALTDCLREECTCAMHDRCNIVSPMRALNDRLITFLNSITLTELINATPGSPGIELAGLLQPSA